MDTVTSQRVAMSTPASGASLLHTVGGSEVPVPAFHGSTGSPSSQPVGTVVA